MNYKRLRIIKTDTLAQVTGVPQFIKIRQLNTNMPQSHKLLTTRITRQSITTPTIIGGRPSPNAPITDNVFNKNSQTNLTDDNSTVLHRTQNSMKREALTSDDNLQEHDIHTKRIKIERVESLHKQEMSQPSANIPSKAMSEPRESISTNVTGQSSATPTMVEGRDLDTSAPIIVNVFNGNNGIHVTGDNNTVLHRVPNSMKREDVTSDDNAQEPGIDPTCITEEWAESFSEQKKNGNSDAAFRYRQKQKINKTKIEKELNQFATKMKKAKTEMLGMRNKLNTIRMIVRDMLKDKVSIPCRKL